MVAMISRKDMEQRAIRLALKSFLDTQGWLDLTYSEGYNDQSSQVTLGQVNIMIIDNGVTELEIGRTVNSDKAFPRIVQVDCYMVSEQRANTIADAIFDFMDLTAVQILDPITSAYLGLMISDTNTIDSRLMPPILTNPALLKWRSITRGQFEAHYFGT